MDKVIWKLIGELKKKLTGKWSYLLGNALVGVKVIFLPDCPLVLFLLKYKGVGAFLNKKKIWTKNEESKQGKPLK